MRIRNPYETPTDRPIVQSDEERLVTYDTTGNLHPLGATKEVNITDPTTADRQYQQTKALVTSADGVLIVDPEKTPTKRCSTCGRLFSDTTLVQPCNGCCTSICNACAHTMKDRGALLRLCGPCYRGTFWRRVWLWILTIFTG